MYVVAPPFVGNIVNTVIVDPANTIFEADETNNTATQATSVGTGVDLTLVKDDSAPRSPEGFGPLPTCAAGKVSPDALRISSANQIWTGLVSFAAPRTRRSGNSIVTSPRDAGATTAPMPPTPRTTTFCPSTTANQGLTR